MVRFIFAVFLSLFLLNAAAAKYTGVYVFGDSLSDFGNHPISKITPLVPVTNPYQGSTEKYGGSSGILWVQFLQRALYQKHLVAQPILTLSKQAKPNDHYVDYAWASAVGGDYFTDDIGIIQPNCTDASAKPLCIPGVDVQISTYLKAHHGKADPNALYLIWGGANDLINNTRDFFTRRWHLIRFNAYRSIVNAANQLANAGAKHIWIMNIPDISLVPGLKNHSFIGFVVQNLVLNYNADLLKGLQASRALKLTDWHFIRVNQDFYRVYYRKGRYAEIFTNVTDECKHNTAAIKANCKGYLFWNNKHPALDAEKLIAGIVLKMIPPPWGRGKVPVAVNPQ